MENLVLTRIDDRLIHGQVMTAWIKQKNAVQVVVADDEVEEWVQKRGEVFCIKTFPPTRKKIKTSLI